MEDTSHNTQKTEVHVWGGQGGEDRAGRQLPVFAEPDDASFSIESLRTPQERDAYRAQWRRALLLWVVFGVVLVPLTLLALPFGWLGATMWRALVKYNGVRVDSENLPGVHHALLMACKRLGLAEVPDAYVADMGGLMNAFALRVVRRHFVVITSSAIDAMTAAQSENDEGLAGAELRFIIGHEVGHLALRHIERDRFLAPAKIFARLAAAYSRGRERSADLCGLRAAGDVDASARALVALAGGGTLAKNIALDGFREQQTRDRSFLIDVMRMMNPYPRITERVHALYAFRDARIAPLPPPTLGARIMSHFMLSPSGQGGLGAALAVIYLALTGVGLAAAEAKKSNEAQAAAAADAAAADNAADNAAAAAAAAAADNAAADTAEPPPPQLKKIEVLNVHAMLDFEIKVEGNRFRLTGHTDVNGKPKAVNRLLKAKVDPTKAYMIDPDGDLAEVIKPEP